MQSTHKRDKNTGRRAGLIAALAYLAVACMVNAVSYTHLTLPTN